MKILLVGGTFDNNKGKQSGIINKINNFISCDMYNGGNYQELKNIINLVKEYEVVLWFPNVSNNLEKIRNVKEINPKVMLVTSKRNNAEYSKQEIIARALRDKANLLLEFDTREEKTNMRISDPLGNEFYYGTDIGKMVTSMMQRIEFLKNIKRKPTFKSIENTPEFKVDESFLNIIRSFANKFHSLINPMETNRFLGNASTRFRCERGFPSQRINNNMILVSRRNIKKESIQSDEFVPVYENDKKLYYVGDYKPSVDTPVQFELYKNLPEVNYMIHSHVYVKDAPYTKNIMPCGALNEVEEIMEVINKNNFKSNFAINLIGHGCTIFARDLDYFNKIEFVERKF
ncbi:MAG: class II aldolase/adducin family protein [Fusobacterium sp.]